MKNKKLIFALGGLLIILSGLISLFISFYGIYSAPNPTSNEEIIFEVRQGEGSTQIAQNLREKDLIRSEFLFHIYAYANGLSSRLQVGEYLLSPSLSIAQIAQKLAAGDIIHESLTIQEGWNLHDIAAYLDLKREKPHETLFTITGEPGLDYRIEENISTGYDFSDEFSFLESKPTYVSLEGFLYPDTYNVTRTDSTETIVRRMLQNFDEKYTDELREETERQGKTIFEIVTMASIIEKEVWNPQDRKIISGILWNRIDLGMRLQVDPSVSYITGRKDINTTIAETQIFSPYNTYRITGLPLGPISNPSTESIEAALYPTDTDYLYFLSANGNTYYSHTFAEHTSKKALYLR